MRGTHRIILALVCGAFGLPSGFAQSKPQFKQLNVPHYDVSVGYSNIRANAPPGGCQCFNMNGGYVGFGMHLTDWLGIAGEVTGGHSSNISVLGQGLTLITFTAGPRVSFQWGRLYPFGEALVGGAHGSDSYFPSKTSSSPSASTFAFSTGGGLDVRLTSRFSVRALEAQYLRTSFPNAVGNEQNQLMLNAGLVVKFGGYRSKPGPAKMVAQPPVPVAPPPPPPPPSVAFSCSTNVANVPLGETVVITGDARTEPANLALAYAWSADGAKVEGNGNVVSVNTTGMAVGDYRVKGQASVASNTSSSAECIAVFRVVPVEVPPAPVVTVVDRTEQDREFHNNVKDAFFDVNSAKIRPDTQRSIDQAAKYLTAHPTIQAILSGWTDPRGSQRYNLALGIKRANAVRNALINAGVSANQLEILSNGKSSQVCTTSDQKCWQDNRRVSFSMKP
jgi:outer membrane protein OmpA-like peptidoglycan-associated protein